MFQLCTQCHSRFEITDEDLAYYDKVSPVIGEMKYTVPPPTRCPVCRHQNRLAFRNERKLYRRKCDFSGREILSIYSPDKPYKVYDQPEWWGDGWDAMIYGRDFDFSRTFTEQFRELYIEVPRVSLHTINVENSYYTCYTLNMKNCYLVFGAGNDEDCMFAKYLAYSRDTVDALCVYSCELCYEAVACEGCYNCSFITNCRNCRESIMLEDCSGCINCIGCFGLRNKEYYVFNEFVGKEKYEEIAREYEELTHEKIGHLRSKLAELKKNLPHIQSHIFASEECTGDAIFNSKNCRDSFDVKDSENCKFIYNSPKCVETYDAVYCAPDGLQFCYNICSCVGTNLMATYFVWYCDNVFYSMDCINSTNLFGCVGLRNKHYCIFNKQYTKEEYEKLVGKIIAHMMQTPHPSGHGYEWGEYLDYQLAPTDYNETVAAEYFPLGEAQAKALGARWHHEEPIPKPVTREVPPEHIGNVTDDVLEKIFTCEVSGRGYKITPNELQFYRKKRLPLPRRHPDQRHYDRLALHGAVTLYTRTCDLCHKSIQSIYGQDAPHVVYCEECYLKHAY